MRSDAPAGIEHNPLRHAAESDIGSIECILGVLNGDGGIGVTREDSGAPIRSCRRVHKEREFDGGGIEWPERKKECEGSREMHPGDTAPEKE